MLKPYCLCIHCAFFYVIFGSIGILVAEATKGITSTALQSKFQVQKDPGNCLQQRLVKARWTWVIIYFSF